MQPEVRENSIPVKKVLGTAVATLDMEGALQAIRVMLASGKSHLVVTADANCLVLAKDDSQFASELAQASLITADGAGVVWALKRQGVILEQKVSGVELAERLIEASAREDTRLFFLGAAPGIAQEAADRMLAKYPGAKIVGFHHGFFGPDEEGTILSEIQKANPNVLLVAMGMPKQERFLLRNFDKLPPLVGMGVGGTLDVFSGRVKRAPKIFQKLKMEWLWRSVLNPKKYQKLINLPRFMRMVNSEKR